MNAEEIERFADQVLGKAFVPPILPGEPIPSTNDYTEQIGPDVSLPIGHWYDPDGQLTTGSLKDVTQTWQTHRFGPGTHLVSRAFYRAGTRIQLFTSYVGVNT